MVAAVLTHGTIYLDEDNEWELDGLTVKGADIDLTTAGRSLHFQIRERGTTGTPDTFDSDDVGRITWTDESAAQGLVQIPRTDSWLPAAADVPKEYDVDVWYNDENSDQMLVGVTRWTVRAARAGAYTP